MPSEFDKAYEKAVQAYRAGQRGGEATRGDKVKASLEMRQIEREAARAGKVLHVTNQGDRVVVHAKEVPTKRELQGEYVRKFDDEIKVKLADRVGDEPREQTLREFHRKRLLGK